MAEKYNLFKDGVLVGQYTSRQISDITDKHVSQIRNLLGNGHTSAEGWHVEHIQTHTKIDDDYVIERIENGATYEELAKELGYKVGAFRQYCVDRGYTYKNRGHITKVTHQIKYNKSLTDKRCANCGKIFTRYTPDWAYRIGNRYFCRYNCMRAFEKHGSMKGRII